MNSPINKMEHAGFTLPARMTGYVNVGDAEVYFESTGSGPSLIFAHGLGGNHISWWQQIGYFADRFQCVTFSHRMFPPSKMEPRAKGAEAFADDLGRIIDHLHLDRVVLVGQSMGGWSCMRYAIQSPRRVRGLFLGATAGMNPARAEFLQGSEVSSFQQGMRERLEECKLVGVLPAAGLRLAEEQPDKYALYRLLDELTSPAMKTLAREGIFGQATLEDADLKKIDCPVSIIVSDEDVIFPSPAASRLAEQLPNATVHQVPNAGHSVFFERPDLFNGFLSRFLEALD